MLRTAPSPSQNREHRTHRRRVTLGLEELENRNLLSVFTPAQIAHAYGFDQVTFANGTVHGTGAGQTIAIVDAYDDPNIASDLQYFDRTFGLPNPKFVKATPEGVPAVNASWAGEIALDVEWAHAIAPGANILLVEAKSNSLTDLLSAVNYAVWAPGVSVVSISWDSAEFSTEASYDSHFATPSGHTGVTFVAASGDAGTPPEWPAVSPSVLSVGGTSLKLNADNSYGSETAWSSSSGGNSSYESKPGFQTLVTTPSTTQRTNPDVAYDADVNTGVYVYDSYNGAWFSFGGTSAGAPQWAGLIAIANQGRALAGSSPLDGASQTLYALYGMANTSYATYFHDVTSGSNGFSAGTGYDLVTGLGSPVANQVIYGLVAWTGAGTAGSLGTGSSSTSTGTSKLATHAATGTPVTLPGAFGDPTAVLGLSGAVRWTSLSGSVASGLGVSAAPVLPGPVSGNSVASSYGGWAASVHSSLVQPNLVPEEERPVPVPAPKPHGWLGVSPSLALHPRQGPYASGLDEGFVLPSGESEIGRAAPIDGDGYLADTAPLLVGVFALNGRAVELEATRRRRHPSAL